MPRGAKGWPIVSYEGPSRSDVISIVAIFGVFFPSLLGIVIPLSGGKVQVGWPLLALLALFAGVIVLMLGLMYFAGGRVRWTPTAVLWVPPLFRPKFVHFADARRLQKGAQRVLFDTGKIANLPAVGHLRGKKAKALRPIREQVDAWLDEHFAPFVPDPANKRRSTARIVLMLAMIPAAMIAPVVLKQLSPWIRPVIKSLPDWQQGTAAAVISSGVMILVLAVPFGAMMIAKYGFGVDIQFRPEWRLRREKWQGFEVEPTAAVASGPPPI